ncbi:secreted frizzled-related protein 5-like isoform X2 [Palaemon carinicauda]|uniref:secreted frizzled-related protein 5-like isoform X2 n=1 Tax=Palaemon carinicauda TaxID=392227 RepID=UPI0035B5C713
MLCWSALSLLPLLLALLGAAEETSAYFADWGMIGGRPQEPTCVDIPQNMPLCSGIDYNKMRLPNLLEHDTLKEAQQQAGYWVPLLNLRCHPDTQLFLCSLFTPVCLESPIYPCRSLCEAVRSGCESRMQTYSFPWPDMLRCDKFPMDNDMCITVQHFKMPGPGDCEACTPVETYENILDNYCRADVVVKTRIKRTQRSKLICRKAKIYKSSSSEEERRALRRPRFSLTMEADCCEISPSSVRYLIMGRKHRDQLIPTFIMPFKKSKPLRQAMKTFKRGLNCSDPNLITRNLEPTALSQEPPPPQQAEPKPKGRRKNRKGSAGGGKGSGRGGKRRKSKGGAAAEGGRRRERPGRRKNPVVPEEEETLPMDITPIPDVFSPEDASLLFDPSQPMPLDIPSSDLQEEPELDLAGGGGGGGRRGGERRGEDGDRQAKKRRRKGNKASRRDRRKETPVTEETPLLEEEE